MGNLKRAGVTMIVSDKIDWKTKTVTRDKEHYSMIETHKYMRTQP